MSKKFTCAASLSVFLENEREQALSYICEELACERDSVAFIFEGSGENTESLEIPRRY